MNKHCLLMLTDYYPFSTGETYIEQEIPFTAQAFDQVWIIPLRATAGAAKTRDLPDNARAFLPDKPQGNWYWWSLKWTPRIAVGKPRMLTALPPAMQSSCRISQKLFSLSPTNSPKTPTYYPHPPKWQNVAIDWRFAATCLETYDRVRRVVQTLDFSQFDSVVIYSYWFYQGVAVADLLRQRELSKLPVRIVARAHRYDVDEEATPRGYLASRPYLLAAADRVYPISEYAAQFLRNYCAPPAALDQKIVVHRLGVPPAAAKTRQQESPLWIASCSFMDQRKRVELIAQAIGLLQQSGLLVRWTHFGESSPQRLKEMQTLIERVCPDPSACELKGFVPNAKVRAFYEENNVQVFVNCSESEGIPVSVMEAQACAIPCVATDVGGTSEIVFDHQNGILLPKNLTAKMLADALSEVAALSPTEYAHWSDSARQTWQNLICAPTQYSDFAAQLRALSTTAKRQLH